MKTVFFLLFFCNLSFLFPVQYNITGSVNDSEREEIEGILQNAELTYFPKFKIDGNFLLNVYVCSDLREFLRKTGASQWNGAYYVHDTIYLQRLPVLKERGILEQTLIHEFLHFCVSFVAGKQCPIWLNEGLVVNLSRETQEIECFHKNVSEDVDFAELDRNLRAEKVEIVREAYDVAAQKVEKLLQVVSFDQLLGVLRELKAGDKKSLKKLLERG